MYKDDGAALRARLEAVEAELVAERKRREAAEAEKEAALARTHELELRLARPPAARREPLAHRAVIVASAVAGGLVILVVAGLLALTQRDAPPALGQSDAPAAAPAPIPYSPARAAKPDLPLPVVDAGPAQKL